MNAAALKRLRVNGSRPSAERLRLVTLPNKNGIRPRPKPHTLDLARGCASNKVADRARISLRTEQVVSFAELCRTKCSPVHCSMRKFSRESHRGLATSKRSQVF